MQKLGWPIELLFLFYSSLAVNLHLQAFTKWHNSIFKNTKFSSFWEGTSLSDTPCARKYTFGANTRPNHPPMSKTDLHPWWCFLNLKFCPDRLIRVATRSVAITQDSKKAQRLQSYISELGLRYIVTLVHTFKSLNNLSPHYISSLLHVRKPPAYSFRSSTVTCLHVPKTRTLTGDRAFSSSAPCLWNNLPAMIRGILPLPLSKSLLNIIFFRISWFPFSLWLLLFSSVFPFPIALCILLVKRHLINVLVCMYVCYHFFQFHTLLQTNPISIHNDRVPEEHSITLYNTSWWYNTPWEEHMPSCKVWKHLTTWIAPFIVV